MDKYLEGFIKTCQGYDLDPQQASETITQKTREFLNNLKTRDVVGGGMGAATGVATHTGASKLLTQLYRNQELAARAGRKVPAQAVRRITEGARGRAALPALIIALLTGAAAGYGTREALKPKRHKITIPLWRKD